LAWFLFLISGGWQMALELHTWKITGVSPLLQNNPAGTMKGSDSGGMSAGKKVYDDQEEADIRVYRTEDGKPMHPTAAFRSGMLEASKGRKIGKTAARTVVAGSVFPAETEALLVDAKGKPLTKYAVHKCRVVVGKSGILRCRPQWTNWHVMLPLEVDRDFIQKLDTITEILNIAGRIIGVGDNRPDTSKGKSGVGTFGRYKAELVN
jgi:hypothetical protein